MTARDEIAAVDVCVCTFRRASLALTLNSLAAQLGAPCFRIIVADNDDGPSARSLVDEARARLGRDIRYMHAPARNISIARNACLEAAGAPLVAFIDDDEIAPPAWLAELVRGVSGVDVVFGPVQAQYQSGAPAWAVRGDFHSFGPAVRANGQIDTGYSSNVLFRRDIVGSLRFDPALGRAGGEDTVFFARLHAGGARLGFAPGATVFEPTPPQRIRLGWLVRRSFRSGQSHARVLRLSGQNALAIAAPAALKALFCGVAATAAVWSPVEFRRNLIRGALHVGVVAKAFGAADVEIYGRSADSAAGKA
jgi:succinoglycan biosynthesis protein ExoM